MASSGDIITDDELALRRAEEAAARRSQAAEWLRRMDHGAAETLPEDPSEEGFCLALRNGLILCNVLNRVNPGAVSKVVESPAVAVQSTDAGAQSAIQYFENMRNFLVAVAEMQLLTFEASDLEKGGSSSKVVDCILCLKGYYEWKLAGGIGVWRYGGIVKITSSTKGWPSPLLGGVNASDSLEHEQQLVEVVHLLSEDLLEESKAPNALGSLFDQFGLRLLQAFLAEWSGTDDLPLNLTLVDLVLEQALKEFYIVLLSQRNQLGSLLRRRLKDNGRGASKAEFIEAILRLLKEHNCGSASCAKLCIHGCSANASNGERIDYQLEQLEKLKLSFHEMRAQVECNRRKWQEDLEKFEKQINGLHANASSYRKLLEENRMLYNQVQDLKGNIRVYCRVRPFLNNQCDVKSTIDHVGENGNIMIINPNKQGKDARKIFLFNKVFGANTTQSEVFVDTQPLIQSVMDGYNVCIFAYGQTGSGKTYTMSGPGIKTEDSLGVNYRALNDLFGISKSRRGAVTYDVSVQMIEIYNEQVRDLLVSNGSNRRLDIRNNSQLNGINIPDASLVSVNCIEDVLDLMKIGHGNRAVGATALNERSSRSHSVLTVHVQGNELVSGSILRGCLHLVDLAGSERVDKSEATGERLKEAQHINRSLSALGDVISALAQKSSHIPYRNSKLTQVLQDALGGQAKTLMFVHINPDINSFGETLSTLKFAERVASIELGAARANKETGELRDLKEEISKLKSALESKELEIEQVKDHNRRLAMEAKSLNTASPLHLPKHGSSLNLQAEGTQRLENDVRQIESRSCSSGKQRKPRFHYPRTMLSDKEPNSGSPFSAQENHVKTRKPSPPSPVRGSLSSDRASMIRSKLKVQTVDERSVLKLRFPEKASASKSISNIPTVLTNGNTRKVFSEREEEVKPIPAMGMQIDSDMDVEATLRAKKRNNFIETENQCSLNDSQLNFNPREKKPARYVTRMFHNTEPRPCFPTVETKTSLKHENRPPNKMIEPEIRRSRSLPRGKFTMS